MESGADLKITDYDNRNAFGQMIRGDNSELLEIVYEDALRYDRTRNARYTNQYGLIH